MHCATNCLSRLPSHRRTHPTSCVPPGVLFPLRLFFLFFVLPCLVLPVWICFSPSGYYPVQRRTVYIWGPPPPQPPGGGSDEGTVFPVNDGSGAVPPPGGGSYGSGGVAVGYPSGAPGAAPPSPPPPTMPGQVVAPPPPPPGAPPPTSQQQQEPPGAPIHSVAVVGGPGLLLPQPTTAPTATGESAAIGGGRQADQQKGGK